MKRHIVFLVVSGIVFSAIAVVFLVLPRSEFSELEKRRLAKFPDYSHEALLSGKYTGDISSWFSDSEPFRDELMTLSMAIKNSLALKVGGGDAVTFHAEPGAGAEEPPQPTEEEIEAGNRDIAEISAVGVDGPAKVASAGIIVAGEEPEVRALMVYYGEATGGAEWAQAANFYKETLPDVDIYCMVVPTAIEFYCPEKVKSRTRSQLSTIRNIYSLLRPDVHAVDAYTPLGTHASEPIYFRTDHHWTPLGAYYVAQKFAETAGVPFRNIEAFEQHERDGFVGSMYGYSKDISVKRSPEKFVYYTPLDTAYTTTYRTVNLNSAGKPVSQTAPRKGDFFMPKIYRGGGSYSMFMGGDMKVTKVVTSVDSPRRLLIIKDSFGNAIPPFLFGSFGEVHVVDFRYFIDNLADYIRDNAVTDVLLMNNIFNSYSAGVARSYRKLLTRQPGEVMADVKKHAPKKERVLSDSTALPEKSPEVEIQTDSIADNPAGE